MKRKTKIWILVVGGLLIFDLVLKMNKSSVLGINFGTDTNNYPIEVIVKIDDKIIFNSCQYPTYIIPDLIPLQLRPGWHEIYAFTPSLDLTLKQCFFTPVGSHLDLIIYQQNGNKGIYLGNSWLKKFYS